MMFYFTPTVGFTVPQYNSNEAQLISGFLRFGWRLICRLLDASLFLRTHSTQPDHDDELNRTGPREDPLSGALQLLCAYGCIFYTCTWYIHQGCLIGSTRIYTETQTSERHQLKLRLSKQKTMCPIYFLCSPHQGKSLHLPQSIQYPHHHQSQCPPPYHEEENRRPRQTLRRLHACNPRQPYQ